MPAVRCDCESTDWTVGCAAEKSCKWGGGLLLQLGGEEGALLRQALMQDVSDVAMKLQQLQNEAHAWGVQAKLAEKSAAALAAKIKQLQSTFNK